ncbi:TNG2 Chromatin remodeling protein contains PhD zinc finger [Pyrenophora tritici-repentis]|nr:PHD finger domain-containing protein [Pyrenophora tritici-repentis]KAF7452500.1 PHD finger domain containing protein [Pyrenophora tritici-repentis]KAI0575291.1 PHD finger domain-containing protein [Pyrenophora tritici-repentis]KAI1533660.1 TNG2 Chromatin remodeling protein contains PhD zinc finger [Pyrenophora tritici-repentis]KAI1536535.1 TNG2 Chromatin remodeling protein contains PhD zinc finger [Pyrenophora tritici-repentis]
MPPTTGTRTSTRQGRATVRPTNYYARTFAGRLAASGMEQTPEAANSAPGFLPALTHFTGAVDAFPKEMIKHFSLFKEVEAKLFDPEHMLKELLDQIAQLPVTTRGQLRSTESSAGADSSASDSPPHLGNASPEEQATTEKRQLMHRLCILIRGMMSTLDEKLVVLQGAKATKDRGLARMHHSYAQLDGEISDEARYGSLTHWAYADKEEKKKGGPSHERQRREVAAANNLAAAAQHVHDVDSIAAKSEARREAMQANKRSRHQQIDSDFDDRPTKKPQKRKPMPTEAAPDNRSVGLGITSNGAGPHNKRKKTEKALAAAAPAAPPMERTVSSALKIAGNGVRGGSSPRGTPVPESGPPKRKPRAPPVPAQRKNPLPTYSPPMASSPLAANFAINKATAGTSDRPLSARARKNSTANSVASLKDQEAPAGRRPSTSHSVQHVTSNAITELEQAAGIVRDDTSAKGASAKETAETSPAFDTATMKLEDLGQPEPERMDIDTPLQLPVASRPGRTSKTATPVIGSFPEISMARSRSSRNANNGTNSTTSSENNSTVTGTVSKRGKKNAQSNAAAASPAMKPTQNVKSNPPSSAAMSYGNMIACDNDDCPREWFHLACVHLEKAPTGRTKWFCSDECKDTHAKAKTKGGRPGSSRQ